MVYVRLRQLLEKRGKSIYWLSSSAGIPYPTLWKLLNKETQSSINLKVLSKICAALKCLPGDILIYEEDEEDAAIANLVDAKERIAKKARKK
jgi:putative transcriptional regulator